MHNFLRYCEKILERGEMLSPRDCVIAVACLTLVSYAVLLVSGRGRW